MNTINKYTFNKIVNNVDSRGWTALHWACYFGNERMVKLLINNEAELDIKTEEGLAGDPEYANKTAKKIAKLKDYKKCSKRIKYCAFKRRLLKILRIGKEASENIPK